MTTTDTEPTTDTAATVEPVELEKMDLGAFLDRLRELGQAADPDNPVPLVTFTGAIYPTPDGGLILAARVPDGPFQGESWFTAKPGMIRAIAALFGGGSVMDRARTLTGGRKGKRNA